jgi:hypothetical protein
MKVMRYQDSDAARWDDFVLGFNRGVFLQTRRYLSYHGDRFGDCSLLIANDDAGLRAVLPAAEAPDDARCVVSHPGATYGSLILHPGSTPDEVVAILDLVCRHYKDSGYRKLVYRALPSHILRPHQAADVYGVWRAGGALVRRDLWNVIDLSAPRRFSKGRKWGIKKAIKAGVRVRPLVAADYGAFHQLLSENLRDRHGTKPTHSLAELERLQLLFPTQIELWGASGHDGELLAGVWLFKLSPHCWHTQYIASNARGRDMCAVDLLCSVLLEQATEAGAGCFSFGASTEMQGCKLNAGLYAFKAGFGEGSAVQDFYEFAL